MPGNDVNPAGIKVSNTHEVRGYFTEENGGAHRKSRKSGETVPTTTQVTTTSQMHIRSGGILRK
jgi:hypothetical protein